MKQIRLHGKGGQGLVTAAEILGNAFLLEGNYASCLPSFGVERRGGAVTAFIRLDDKPIRLKDRIYTPDCLIVTSPDLLTEPDVFLGLQAGSTLILNTHTPVKENLNPNLKTIGAVDAISIAMKEMGIPVVSTGLLGALVGTTNWLKLDSLTKTLGDYFKGNALKGNIRCLERGFQEVKVSHF